jgi:uncharacterized membrane protein
MAEHVPLNEGPRPTRSPAEKESLRRYWRSNLRIMAVLLAIWFVAGLGCSIVVFVVVILVYCLMMNRLDRKHHDELVRIRKEEGR